MDFKAFLLMSYLGSFLFYATILFLFNSGLFSPVIRTKFMENIAPEVENIISSLNALGESLSVSSSSDLSGFGQYFGLLFNILMLVINIALLLALIPAKTVLILFWFLTEILGANYLFDTVKGPLQVITTTLYLFGAYMYVARGETF